MGAMWDVCSPMAMLRCPVPFTYPWSKCNCLGNQLDIMGKSVHWPQLLMDKYPETWACKCASTGLCCSIKDLYRALSAAICVPMEMSSNHKHSASDTQSYKVLTILFYLYIINGFNNAKQDWIRDMTLVLILVITEGNAGQRSRAALVFMTLSSTWITTLFTEAAQYHLSMFNDVIIYLKGFNEASFSRICGLKSSYSVESVSCNILTECLVTLNSKGTKDMISNA